MASNSSALATTKSAPLAQDLEAFRAAARRAGEYAKAARAPSTKRAYAADMRAFVTWCEGIGASSLPAQPEIVALYLAHLADEGSAVATIDRALVAISQAHKLAGFASPRSEILVREVHRGIRRTLGRAQRRAKPIMPKALREIVTALPSGLLGTRDRALLLVGFASALRRSELVALDVEDLVADDAGIVLRVRRSKTDQEGVGRDVGIVLGADEATCPVRWLRRWLELAHITSGAVFRGVTRHGHVTTHRLDGGTVARVVKRSALAAGIDPTVLSGHSLRAGLATAAAKAGKPWHVIMAQTGHRSMSVFRRYVRDAEVLDADANASAGIGL
jgi:integrase